MYQMAKATDILAVLDELHRLHVAVSKQRQTLESQNRAKTKAHKSPRTHDPQGRRPTAPAKKRKP